ncbi:hypothetical protein [Bradyrhizobium sp. BR 1433]|uniref:hypothetical protein n=1 Tax=Bradyrhizobium sp. BR 1433 TaxID=3447967 RepID=UPI003EE5A151
MPNERRIYRLSTSHDLDEADRTIRVVGNARKLLAESPVSTFLGRKTQEPFPQGESRYGNPES